MLKNIRKYGKSPFGIAVIHGGPGAPGCMAPVARELCQKWGVLEPLQTATSLEGQVQELKDVLEEHGDLPVTLIGSLWGAMLSFIFSARYPACTKKVILIGSGAFEEKYAGRRLIDLPETYVVWFAKKGFPKGELGEMLQSVYEIKVNGLEYLFKPFKNE